MTEYHKIETLYERDPVTFRVQPRRLKNRAYGLLKRWRWTEKIDGTNIRCCWDGARVRFGGKTEQTQIHADLFMWLSEHVQAEALAAIFPGTDAVIYGEGYGAGIQKGGAYSATKKLIVFDVLVAGKWWLSFENTSDVATKLGLDHVPYYGEMTLDRATEMVRAGFDSSLGDPAHRPRAEGLVGRPEETLFDKKGARLICKLKTKDF